MRALLATFASSQTPTPSARARFVVSHSHALSSPLKDGETAVQMVLVVVTTLDSSLVHVHTSSADVCQTVYE